MCSFMCVCMYVYLYILKDILLRVQKTFICLQQHMLHKGEGEMEEKKKVKTCSRNWLRESKNALCM